MANMTDRLESDLAAAIEDGRIDEERHGTLMEAARRCAREIDENPAPKAALFTTMLNYCKALRLAPTDGDDERRRRAGGSGKLADFRARSRGATMDEMRAKFARADTAAGRTWETPLEKMRRELDERRDA